MIIQFPEPPRHHGEALEAAIEPAVEAAIEMTLWCLAGEAGQAEAVARTFPHPYLLAGVLRLLSDRLRAGGDVVAALANELRWPRGESQP